MLPGLASGVADGASKSVLINWAYSKT